MNEFDECAARDSTTHAIRESVCPIACSASQLGPQIKLAAVGTGACLERHITLDRTMWGSDRAASVVPRGMMRLVRDIRVIETAMGDGIQRIYQSELPTREKLRTTTCATTAVKKI